MQPTNQALQDCADEPIRIPGSIQQHGFFLLTLPDYEVIVGASENVDHFLNVPSKLVIGSKLDDLFEREITGAFRFNQRVCAHGEDGLVTYLGTFRIGKELFSLMTHCIGPYRALEFERQDSVVGPEVMNAVITNFVSTITRLRNKQDLCEAITQQFATLTGFDRILLYNFDADGHGTVLSEINNGKLPSYLGLAFPATDIPQQARDLYVLNTIRIIPDVEYTPSPLVGSPSVDVRNLDLSLSLLRSVSPIHLQYMRNMGTRSSMSVSIVLDGKLWGLISAHHSEPKVVPYLIRSALDMLAKMAATQLDVLRTAQELEHSRQFHAVQRKLLTLLAADLNYLDALRQQLGLLQQVTNAQGVALLLDGQISTAGNTPNEAQLRRIADWLRTHSELSVVVSSNLEEDIPEAWKPLAAEIRDVASGLLVVRISSVRPRWLLWFRPEVVSTITWAGNPADAERSKQTLTPRASFENWKQVVRGRSLPWTQMETDSAVDFRGALTTVSLRRAEEALEEGEARFHQLTQALPLKIFTLDDSGRVTYANDRWREAGLRVAGLWFEDPLLHSDDSVSLAERWSQAVRQGSYLEAEIRVGSAGEERQRWNLLRIIPFHRPGAPPAGWVGTLVDLTERREREAAMRMSEKLALTGRMTSVIAHEINNPLEAITNLMYLLNCEIPKGGNAAGYISMVQSELDRISGITKQTLRWNRQTSDSPETAEAGPLVDDVLRLFTGKIRNRQAHISIRGDRSLPLRGYQGQLRQVLANLVSNAIDATPIDGSGHVEIILKSQPASEDRPDRTGISVCDNGKGIPAEAMGRLFEPFNTTKGDLGNGLGLYISREIVERHGGNIDVESEPGHGTKVTFWLPA